jgi:hypothetical protein
MADIYNIASITTINTLQEALNTPMLSSQTFLQFYAQFRTTFQALNKAGQPPSEYNLIKYITTNTSTNLPIQQAIKDYNTSTPIVANQSLAAFTKYIILHSPHHATMATQGYANSATTAVTKEDVAAMIKAAYSKGVQDNKRDRRPPNSSPIAKTKTATKYCFCHGYTFTHTGKECLVMANDKQYTQQQKDAVSPTSSPGGNTNSQK